MKTIKLSIPKIRLNFSFRMLLGPALLLVISLVAMLVPQTKQALTISHDYPAVICPGALSGGTQIISLPAKKLQIRGVGSKSLKPFTTSLTQLGSNSNPTYVSGNSGSEIAFNTIAGSISAAAVCSVGEPVEWFIGGSAGVTSSGVLNIVNSGLSESSVMIYPFTSKVALAPIPVKVKANSDSKIPLSSIAPGERSVALKVVTQSGRVTSFLLDHQKQGLREIGASFVNPVFTPTKTVFIGGLFNGTAKNASSSHLMRFLVPGSINANVSMTLYSGDGSFTPLGFDQLSITHQKVTDIELPTLNISSPFGIEITSDQPIFASTLTNPQPRGGRDYAWATQLSPISKFGLNLAGNSANFVFMGKQVSLELSWQGANGKTKRAILNSPDVAVWKPTETIRGLTITPRVKTPIYGGAVLMNPGGTSLNYLPLVANQVLAGASLPTLDIRTLTHD
jgi:hypothetical protein